MQCDTGYSFARVYQNIVGCECTRCDDSLPEYAGDEPADEDLLEFAELDNTGEAPGAYRSRPYSKKG